MSQNDTDFQAPHAAEGPEMIAAMREGVNAALEEHKRLGNPVVVWERSNGRVLHVPSEEILISRNDPGSARSSD